MQGGRKVALENKYQSTAMDPKFKYCASTRVEGHGGRICEYLLKRPDWRVYGIQKWFVAKNGDQYFSPLGNRLVDFCDEPIFSRLCHVLIGRKWLDHKDKICQLVPDLMPETFTIEHGKWRDGRMPADRDDDLLPWFVKESEGNDAVFVQVCEKASQCMGLAKPDATHVVQQHVKDALLYEGRKFHIKVHVLVMTMEDGTTWKMYTSPTSGYLNISSNLWVPGDISKPTQVVRERTRRIGDWKLWPDLYPKCKATCTEVIQQGVAQGKLMGRPGKKQFEIISTDFMVDTHGKVWLLEFNMGPVMTSPEDEFYNSAELNESDILNAALDIVVGGHYPEQNQNPSSWDFAGEFTGLVGTAGIDFPAGQTDGDEQDAAKASEEEKEENEEFAGLFDEIFSDDLKKGKK